ncbi:MAG: putative lipid II flippase FtsW [Spirochaetes bacterium]|nr:putative lipid II flippase FtsW [Deltaproteobacteria bacterium]RKY03909.1 MAG: putative lipid II flippase FtsW [Spirochaetota bacterium]
MNRKLPDILKKSRFDYILLVDVLLLVGIGVVMVYSSSAIIAEKKFGDPFYFLKRDTLNSLIGIFLMLIFSFVPYLYFKKAAFPIFIISLLLLILVLIPNIGKGPKDIKRWIDIGIGIRFQPSEFFKLAIIIFLASYLAKCREKVKEFTSGVLMPLIFIAIPCILILFQPDFGTVVLIFAIGFILIFIAGARLRDIMPVLIFIIVPIFILLITKQGYRYNRILAFIDPWKDPEKTGFQIIQSFIAFVSGGKFGLGLGESQQKLFFLPAAHTDFIFAILGEEMGLLGVFVVVFLFSIIVILGFRIAWRIKEPFGTYLATGIVVMIALQTIINMGVVMGIFPTKGLTLPFISYGGSSLVVNLIGMGILLNISSYIRD